jgi:hypothetical protein
LPTKIVRLLTIEKTLEKAHGYCCSIGMNLLEFQDKIEMRAIAHYFVTKNLAIGNK